MSWFLDHRMRWIAETLRVFGFINRGHLQRKFELSRVQASKDLNLFLKLYPGVMAYDLSRKRYAATRAVGQ